MGVKTVDVGVGSIVGVVDFRVDPYTFVVGVVDLLGLPLAFVFGVVDHRSFPFAIGFVVPVLGLGSFGVGDLFGDVVVAFGLFIFGIIDLGFVDPVGGLGLVGVLDLLGGEEIPVIFQFATFDFFAVNVDLVRVVRLDDEGVDVSHLVVLGRDGLLNEVVFALVVENDVNPLGAGAANIGTKHNGVVVVTGELLLDEALGHNLDVATTAVNLLRVLDRKLDNHLFVFVGKVGHLGGQRIKPCILGSLKTFVGLSIAVEVSGIEDELAGLASRFLPLASNPAVLPGSTVSEGFLEVHFTGDNTKKCDKSFKRKHLKSLFA
mmetsp:Transcript_41596/g.81600  ORF Transcript_41596/g.81600 Transcript_41596/m.81600 type:complete len:319 (+) Transcript_41596:502-1458(+)